MSAIFEQARACISSVIIERLLPGGRWDAGEYWVCNPTRADNTPDSFSISESGLWHDFAEGEDSGGDLIDLLAAWRGGTKKEAAAEIIRLAGGTVADDRPTHKIKRDKVKPLIPAPQEALKSLNAAAIAAWVVERHGRPVKGWPYRTAEGGVAFAITRHEKPDGSKDVLPWYYGEDGKWHQGQAYQHGRPLYKLDQIVAADRGTPVLVVEGEKCASVDVPGYMVTTWAGGSSATAKADWSPLEGRQVIIWPDADTPGAKAAAAIERRLPGARVLTVAGKKSGWDLADAVAEGVDPVAFINTHLPAAADSAREDDNLPFLILGYDEANYYFYRKDKKMMYSIGVGSFSASKILDVAPLSFWSAGGMTSDKEGIRVTQAQDYLVALSLDAGSYDSSKLRGTGVWRDKDGIALNDGQRLVFPDNTSCDYSQHRSDYTYVMTSVRFGVMSGPEATDEDGAQLEELFRAQSWSSPSMALLAMGWALIAPFGGMLKWRPHIWLTGRKGSGKSWVLENLITPLCGPFAHRGSGKDTEAGIRRSLKVDARPVILDEMEPKGQKATEKIASLLELARNASSDGSGYITIAGSDGGTQCFVVRSCFCFGSIQTPDEGAAIASRISKLELKAVHNQGEKFKASANLYNECMGDPVRFTRRIFRAIPRVLSDIEWLRTELLDLFGDQRKADQAAPMLAAAWAIKSNEPLHQSADGKKWLTAISVDLSAEAKTAQDDEEEIIALLLAAHIRIDNGVKTVAELLYDGYINFSISSQNELARYGIKVWAKGLAIADKNEQIKKILSGTPYATGYGALIKRHKFCTVERPVQVRLAGNRAQCWILDWDEFRAEYIEDIAATLPDDLPF